MYYHFPFRWVLRNDEIKANFKARLRQLIDDYAKVYGPESITYNRHAW